VGDLQKAKRAKEEKEKKDEMRGPAGFIYLMEWVCAPQQIFSPAAKKSHRLFIRPAIK
jgi:hypothetical protein